LVVARSALSSYFAEQFLEGFDAFISIDEAAQDDLQGLAAPRPA
jgi:hypothetical protein